MHGLQSLLVDVVDQSHAHKLANGAEGVQTGNQPAQTTGGLGGLTDGTQRGNIADQGSAHDSDDGGGANALSQLTEEGVQSVDDALLALAGLPLGVVDGIAHHSPGNAVVEAHAQAEEHQTDHVAC